MRVNDHTAAGASKRSNPVIELVVVGAEILSGRTADANVPYMRDVLADAGFRVAHVSIVGDDVAAIAGVFATAARRADIIIATGGLGPTSDDVTAEALGAAFGLELEACDEARRWMEEMFARRGRAMSPSNLKQAMLPRGAEAIRNPLGTAPGIRLVATVPGRGGMQPVLYLLPGVPDEMQALFDDAVMPRIRDAWESGVVRTRVLRVTGFGESTVYDMIRELPGVMESVAYYPGRHGIELAIRTDEASAAGADSIAESILAVLGDAVYAADGETMEEVVAGMLVRAGVTLGVAESCTGGMISSRLTDIPGSSAYMLLGVTAYANEAKSTMLGVDADLMRVHGAVSAEVAAAMAEGVRKAAGADIGISTTGIAGPGGATPEKPVGLLFAGLADHAGVTTKRLQFFEERSINKDRMSQAVLDMLRRHLMARACQ